MRKGQARAHRQLAGARRHLREVLVDQLGVLRLVLAHRWAVDLHDLSRVRVVGQENEHAQRVRVVRVVVRAVGQVLLDPPREVLLQERRVVRDGVGHERIPLLVVGKSLGVRRIEAVDPLLRVSCKNYIN